MDRREVFDEFRVIPAKTAEDYAKEEFMRRFNLSGIPKSYLDAAYDKIPEDAPYLKGMNVWKDRATESIKKGQSIDGIYLYGPVGSGKSSIAAIFSKWLIASKVMVRWTKFLNLYETMLNTEPMRENGLETAWQIYQTCKVLVIDDAFHHLDGKWGKFNSLALEDILEIRGENNLTTIITANMRIERLEEAEKTIRIANLIRNYCYTLEIDWLDYRTAIGEEFLGEL